MALANSISTIDLDRSGLTPNALIDPFQRAITYLRVSVTDRCDFRCVYCMSEHMTFLPKADLLSLEELDRLCSAFVAKGVHQVASDRRRTAGPAGHHDAGLLACRVISRAARFKELTLTTNGSQLQKYASELKAHGVERINVSLDTLDADKFRAITRWGDLDKVHCRHRCRSGGRAARSRSTLSRSKV